MSISDSLEFRVANANVTTSGAVTSENIRHLQQEGYHLVINLLPDDHAQALQHEQQIIEGQGVEYRYIPVIFTAPTQNDYFAFKSYMNEFSDNKVHLHCAANYRASAFYSLYAYEQGIWTRQQSFDFIASIWSVDEYPAWEHFLKQNGL